MNISIQHHNQARISSSDRCFNYGDGCFTTMLAVAGQIQLLDFHIRRLQRDCGVLGFEPIDWAQLSATLLSLPGTDRQVIKVLISRGLGGRGYGAIGSAANEPQIYISLADFPTHYDQWQRQGVRLGLSEIKLGLNPLLAGLKHCNRLEQVLIKGQLAAMNAVDDLVVTDLNDHIIECSASNLFWLKGDRWYTPKLTSAGVDGVMRRFIIEQRLLSRSGRGVDEVSASIDDLGKASSGFMCNALMGVVPLQQVNLKQLGLIKFDRQPSLAIGAKVTQLLAVTND